MPKTQDSIAGLFTRFAEIECRGRSPLYEKLSHFIATDPELLAIATHGRDPIPNLFFGAVHYLLHRDRTADLRRFYPSLNPNFDASLDPSDAFRAYCITHAETIIEILRTRFVQTNEAARCGYFLLAFTLIWELGGRKPLSLIEVGTSAGLLLCFDRYAYDYGDGRVHGDESSPLKLSIEVRGAIRPPLGDSPPPVSRRIGIDLHPIRPDDADGLAWLEALIWPEHHERRRNLRLALEMVRQSSIEFIAGDASEQIAEVLKSVEVDSTPCVFQSAALNQFSPEARSRFFLALDEFGKRRELFFLSRESQLTLDRHQNGQKSSSRLAECDAHGRWVEWLA